MRENVLTSTPSQLAMKAGVSKATMNGLLNRLLKDGLISRINSEADGRSCRAKLNSLGQAKLDEVIPAYYRCVNKLMHSINGADRDLMIEQLMILQNCSVFES